eukprot:scaffold11463_cov124-Isochrysis_galbana.AAC.11
MPARAHLLRTRSSPSRIRNCLAMRPASASASRFISTDGLSHGAAAGSRSPYISRWLASACRQQDRRVAHREVSSGSAQRAGSTSRRARQRAPALCKKKEGAHA